MTETIPAATPAQKLALLEETVAFYGADPEARRSRRYHEALGTMTCIYRGPNGTACAIGRLLQDGEVNPSWDKRGVGVCLIFDDLPPRVQAYGSEFLRMLQGLHDDSEFWAHRGLTPEGVDYAQSIRDAIASDSI